MNSIDTLSFTADYDFAATRLVIQYTPNLRAGSVQVKIDLNGDADWVRHEHEKTPTQVKIYLLQLALGQMNIVLQNLKLEASTVK